MTNYGDLIRNVLEDQIRRDLSTSGKLSRAQKQVRAETEAFAEGLSTGRLDEMELTPFQERFRSTLEELTARVEAFIEATANPTDHESTVEKAKDLVAMLGGHIMGLESRVAAIEIALHQVAR